MKFINLLYVYVFMYKFIYKYDIRLLMLDYKKVNVIEKVKVRKL